MLYLKFLKFKKLLNLSDKNLASDISSLTDKIDQINQFIDEMFLLWANGATDQAKATLAATKTLDLMKKVRSEEIATGGAGSQKTNILLLKLEGFMGGNHQDLSDKHNGLSDEDITDARWFHTNFVKLLASADTKIVFPALCKFIVKDRSEGNLPVSENIESLEQSVLVLHFLRKSEKIKKLLQSKILSEKDLILVAKRFVPMFVKLAESQAKNTTESYQEFEKLGRELEVTLLSFEDVIPSLGIELTRKLLECVLVNKNIDLRYIALLVKQSVELLDPKEPKDEKSNSEFFSYLKAIATEEINEKTWGSFKGKVEDSLLRMHYKKFPEKPMKTVLDEFATVGPDVAFPLSAEELKVLSNQYEIVKGFQETLAKSDEKTISERQEKLKEKLKKDPKDMEAKLELLAIIREQIKRTFGVFPYNVQMLNILALLNAPNSRRIAQIKTGEGKSMTIAMLAAIEAYTGPVDVATSSEDLALRDAEKFKLFYQSLGLTARHCKTANSYKADIVYGTTYEFEFDYMHDGLGADIRKGRASGTMIVDEVDSMFLDTQANPAIISTKNENQDKSEELYKLIWDYMNREDAIKETAVLKKYLAEHLKGAEEFSDRQITKWMYSVAQANRLQEGKHYVVKGEKIVIVDYQHTGQLLESQRWFNGLHAFVELKHNLKVESEDLTGAQITHSDYFNLYTKLYGLSGTLGPKEDRDELVKLYNVSSYDSPTYRESKRKIEAPLIGNTKEAYYKLALEDVTEKIKAGRPVLGLCETIRDAEMMHKVLKESAKNVQLHTGMQNESADVVFDRAGNPDSLLIATNNAARGADIKISNEARKNGGLHLAFFFPSINKRVENQGFGRFGRQGDPGTGRYILSAEQILQKMNSPIYYGNSLFEAWQKDRELRNKQVSVQRYKSSYINHLQFVMQALFFAVIKQADKIVPEGPDKFKQPWAECFTEMQSILDDLTSRTDFYEASFPLPEKLSLEIKNIISNCLNEFWEKSGLEKSGKLGNPLHFAVSQHNIEMVELLGTVKTDFLYENDLLRRTPRELAIHLTKYLIVRKSADRIKSDKFDIIVKMLEKAAKTHRMAVEEMNFIGRLGRISAAEFESVAMQQKSDELGKKEGEPTQAQAKTILHLISGYAGDGSPIAGQTLEQNEYFEESEEELSDSEDEALAEALQKGVPIYQQMGLQGTGVKPEQKQELKVESKAKS